MPEDDLITQLQKQLSALSDYVDDLWFQFTKKTGSSGASIYGSMINSVNFVKGVSGWQLTPDGNLEANNGNFRGDITGASGTFSGAVTGGSLNIPDVTTANSFHTDSSGNSWWGANVASGYAAAKAYILNTGQALFTTITITGATTSFVQVPLTKVYIAGGAIAANDAVYLDGYQSDGGVTSDVVGQGTGTADGSGNATLVSINVGSNSNRILVVGLFVNSATASSAALSYNGSAMTQIDKVQMPAGGGFVYTFYIVAPSTGAHNLTGTGFTATAAYRYHFASYYNAKQSGQADGHSAATGVNSASASVTPTIVGSLFWGFTVDTDATSGMTTTGIPNNQATGSTSFQGASGDNGNITLISQQTLSASDGVGTHRVAAFAVSIAPITTAVPSVKSTSALVARTANSFIGFANASATAGNNVTIFVSGEVPSFSNLIFGNLYYLSDTTGLISTTAGTVTRKVGIATSSATLLITNLW